MKAKMFFCFVSLALVSIIALPTFAQNQFVKALGGGSYDEGYSVTQTSDSGFVVTGNTESFDAGLKDPLLAKFDADGNYLWARTLGGSHEDEGYSVIEVSGGDLVVTGRTVSFGAGSDDILLVKFDANGNFLWAKTLGGGSSDRAHALTQTSDGGFVVIGWTYSFGAGDMDLPIAKFNANGNLLWAKTLGGSGWDYGSSVIETSDSGIVVTGWTSSFDVEVEDVLLSKFDASGNHLWTRTLGGSSNDVSYSVTQTIDDQGFVLTGDTKSFGVSNWDVLLAKFDTDGNYVYAETLGGEFSEGGRQVIECLWDPTYSEGLEVIGTTENSGQAMRISFWQGFGKMEPPV